MDDDFDRIPDYIQLVSTVSQAKKVVTQLLKLESPLCLPVVFKRAGLNDNRLTLLGISMGSKYYVFDLRDTVNMVNASGLFRLFVTPNLLKVTHEGSRDIEQLVNVRMAVQSLFDTHKAFDRVAHWNGMPNRKISIAALHRKLNTLSPELDIEEAELASAIQYPVFVDNTGFEWGKRPISVNMLIQISAEVAALRLCYFGLRCIGRQFENFSDLQRAERKMEAREMAMMAVGSSVVVASKAEEEGEGSKDSRQVALCSGIQKNLLSMGQTVLDDTCTMGSYRLIPYCYWNN